jgi:hypothetical protein
MRGQGSLELAQEINYTLSRKIIELIHGGFGSTWGDNFYTGNAACRMSRNTLTGKILLVSEK